MDGFRRNDHEQILDCLTDDVEWIVPGAFRVRKAARSPSRRAASA
jgi:ketosteroid isomerase-like protein